MALMQKLKIHHGDRNLMIAYGASGLLSLAGAGALAIILVLTRIPAFGADSGGIYYRILTGHTILGFVYWFAFIQAALLVAGATVLRDERRLWGLKLGWTAFAFTSGGLIINMAGVFSGADVLYTAFPLLSATFTATPLIYLGYLFVAIGALLITISFIGSVFTWVDRRNSLESWKKMLGEVHISTFAAICATVLLIAIGLAGLTALYSSVSMGWLTFNAAEFAYGL